ncbi:hypothetical protein F0562_017388 [Nyssa sinensis]|uniref:Phorbol-ester/DAG-type domain-containing protein n=1 Tax=Nyssa sinensis TaxID=561372 RepID=A0A5J4ZEZ4_9ASTE|nr:hypothetical protein F0562_017388 [Nyssa sinensis]
MGFVHFSHDHPLILNEEKKHDGEEVRRCNGCLAEIVPGPYYCCSKRDFFLHKLCAELPLEMQHHMHPEHPLTLIARRGLYCNVCGEQCKNFTYACLPFDFYVDILCASLMERKIEHKSHKHPLILLRRPALLFCYACGTEHKGIFYFCTTCGQFWMNKHCASLPSTIEHSDHHHLLSLAYSLPYDYYKFQYTCDICGKYFNRVCWFYYCKECRYLAHVNCATSKPLPDRKTKNLTEDVYPRLPVSDESPICQTTAPLACCEIWPDDGARVCNHLRSFYKPKIQQLAHQDLHVRHLPKPFSRLVFVCEEEMDNGHFSHEHPLILNEEKKHDGEEVRHCNGCLEEIVPGPYYCCSKCDFFLHKLCAELPRGMQHHMHLEHRLTLIAHRGLYCNACGEQCKNFTYACLPCDFYVDILCASLMERKIEHKSHKHPLILLRRPALLFCYACGTEHKGIFYFCTTCGQFWMNKDCASLPSTIEHSDHHHLLSLAYSLPYDYYKFQYTCDICGKYFNRVCWFYYCKECRYLAHVNCATSKPLPGNSFLYLLFYHLITLYSSSRFRAQIIFSFFPFSFARPKN